MARIVLITGGARSGKSAYALARAEALSGRRLFVATCPKVDAEMAERVHRHRQERFGRGWATIEEERDLTTVLRHPGQEYDILLIDCLTLWVNNLIHHEQEREIDQHHLLKKCASWLAAAGDHPGQLFCVTNELGQGIVPDNALARRYRDLVGSCNQFVAARAEEVVLVCCGIPLSLKEEKGCPPR